MGEELTTRILIEIRDEIRKTNGRLDQTNERLDQSNERLSILARLAQGIDARLGPPESGHSFPASEAPALPGAPSLIGHDGLDAPTGPGGRA